MVHAPLILSCTILLFFSLVSCDTVPRLTRSEENAKSLKIQCPENQTFCEQVPNYPSNIIRNILKKNPALLHSYFHSTPTKQAERSSREVSNADSSKNPCKVVQHITYPRILNNTDGQEKHIINNEYYWQPVTIFTCKTENSNCNREKRSFFNIFGRLCGSKCIQKYQDVELITYDPIKWRGEYNTFKVPSGCACEKSKE